MYFYVVNNPAKKLVKWTYTYIIQLQRQYTGTNITLHAQKYEEILRSVRRINSHHIKESGMEEQKKLQQSQNWLRQAREERQDL